MSKGQDELDRLVDELMGSDCYGCGYGYPTYSMNGVAWCAMCVPDTRLLTESDARGRHAANRWAPR